MMNSLRIPLLTLAALFSGACADEGAVAACPSGPSAPLDLACSQPELTCRYGYEPLACGGRTVICRGGRFQELEHTDPSAACFDAALPPRDASLDPDASDAMAPQDGATDASGLCKPEGNLGGCLYVRTPGIATVSSITTPAAGAYSCTNDGVEVRFTFVPDDPARAACFVGPTSGDSLTFRVGAGAHPPRACLTTSNVTVGTTLQVVRGDLASGTCSPVVFDFPSALATNCLTSCAL